MGVGHAGHSDAARSRGLLSVCRFAVWPPAVRRVGSVDSEPGLSGPANWLQVGGLRRRGVHAACATRGQASARATGTATGSGPTSSDSCAYRSRAAGASVPVLRSRRRRQNRPAASSQAEGKCEITNSPQCSVYRPAPGSSRMHISSTNNPPGPGPRGTPVPFYPPSRSRSLGGHKTTKLAKVLS